MGTHGIIKEIQSGKTSNEKLEEYLLMDNVFVLSNVMKELVKRKLTSNSIEVRLMELNSSRDKEHVLMGIYTIGHLSMATLVQLGYKAKEMDTYKTLDDFDKKIVDDMVKSYHEVL